VDRPVAAAATVVGGDVIVLGSLRLTYGEDGLQRPPA
jgi:hypothetical protein